MIASTPSSPKTTVKVCASCGDRFAVTRRGRNRRACSIACAKALFRGVVGGVEVRRCGICGSPFKAMMVSKTNYCSRKCATAPKESKIKRAQVHEARKQVCVICGAEFWPANMGPRAKPQNTCSIECGGLARRGCLGDTRFDASSGYMLINIAPRKWRREHIVVAEREMGRPLKRGEVVHHRNGNKIDNKPENLQVMTRREHMLYHREAEKIGLTILAQRAALPMLAGEWNHPIEGMAV